MYKFYENKVNGDAYYECHYTIEIDVIKDFNRMVDNIISFTSYFQTLQISNKNKIKNSTSQKCLELRKIRRNNISMTAKF